MSRQRSVLISLGVLLSGLALTACADKIVTPDPVVGWRSAGLELPDAENSGGVHRLTHIGNTLFAMDAYSVDDGMFSKKFLWRLWQGRVGSNQWSQLSMPNGEIPNRWTTIGNELYVGSKYSHHVYAYDVQTSSWRRLDLAPGKVDTGEWRVDLLGVWKGALVVGVVEKNSNHHYTWVGSSPRQNPARIFPAGIMKAVPPDQVVDVSGTLYGISTQFGIFRFRESDSTWEALPSARGKTDPQEDEGVSAIGEFEGKLLVGYEGFWDGLFRWEGTSWISMTPTPGGTATRRETPKSIYAITSHQGMLFMGGLGGGDPMVRGQTDSSGVKFGSWKIFDANWCRIMKRCPPEIRSIMGIGDTLYASAWTFAGKIPMSQIDESSRPLFKN